MPFAGNIIPASMINPVSAAILALIPGTNESYNIAKPANNYFALLPYTKTTDSFDVKIDDNLTNNDRLSGRISYSKAGNFPGAPVRQCGRRRPGRRIHGNRYPEDV